MLPLCHCWATWHHQSNLTCLGCQSQASSVFIPTGQLSGIRLRMGLEWKSRAYLITCISVFTVSFGWNTSQIDWRAGACWLSMHGA
jgi:hypothetical protein